MPLSIFGIPEAQHFCNGFTHSAGPAAGSLRDYVTAHVRNVNRLHQGTPAFAAYRDCALRDVERCLFLSVSHFHRALDLMTSASSPWAHVTLYYGSFFAANALLGMFGVWTYNRLAIDVVTNTPGNQELRITRNVVTVNQGPHRSFWELFYDAMRPLYPWVDPALLFALQPVGGNVIWQIDNRNSVNYDTFVSLQMLTQFQGAFRRTRFPTSLPGVLNTQFRISDGLVRIVCAYAQQFGLATDALIGFLPNGTRRAKMQRLIFSELAPAAIRRGRRRPTLV